METQEFKKTIINSLIEKGFEKKQNFFYKSDRNLIYVLRLQKSKYSDCFYLNVGYLIKELHPDNKYPKDVDGDVRTRFCWGNIDSKSKSDIIELESVDKITIEGFILSNLEKLINSVQNNGLTWLIKEDPTILYQTTVIAKKYLKLI